MIRLTSLAGAMLLAALPAPLLAQDVQVDPAAATKPSAADQVAAVPGCKPRKKKGFGLGGLLKAASKTGLTNMVGGGLLGHEGAIASTAINTGASVAESSQAKPRAEESGC